MKRSRVRSTAFIAQAIAGAAATVVALSACSISFGTPDPDGTQDPDQQQQQEQQQQGTSQPPVENQPTETAGGSVGSSSVVQIGTEFTDSATGDIITVVSAVRNVPTDNLEATDNPNGELLFLEVKVVPGTTYTGAISSLDFSIESAGQMASMAPNGVDELEGAGYSNFDHTSRTDGEYTGYIPIWLKQTSPVLKGEYVRGEAEVIGEGKKVPEFRSNFEVPAS